MVLDWEKIAELCLFAAPLLKVLALVLGALWLASHFLRWIND